MNPAPSLYTKNVLGEPLQICCTQPMTGYFRDGFAHTDDSDVGKHVVCVKVTAEFLAFSAAQGNPLHQAWGEFPGLKPGDFWCLCALRWLEAYLAGQAPQVCLEATHEIAAAYIPHEALLAFALSPEEARLRPCHENE